MVKITDILILPSSGRINILEFIWRRRHLKTRFTVWRKSDDFIEWKVTSQNHLMTKCGRYSAYQISIIRLPAVVRASVRIRHMRMVQTKRSN